MLKWLTLKEATQELGYNDTRTFKAYHMQDYPPDRINGKRKWWLQSTVDKIKEECNQHNHEDA